MTMLNWHLIERKNMESKILVDTNVLLDYFLTREPFFNDAKQIIEKCADGMCRIILRTIYCYKKYSRLCDFKNTCGYSNGIFGIGTVAAAFTMGKGIVLMGKLLDKKFAFVSVLSPERP